MRVLWILLMICGVIVLGGLAVMMLYGLYLDRDALRLRAIWGPLGLLLAAGACGAGVFMKPHEFREYLKPTPEPEEKVAPWLQEMRNDKRPDSD